MSLVKIDVNFPEIAKTLETFAVNRKKAFDSLVRSFSFSVSEAMELLLKHEIEIFLGKPDQADNKLNGFYLREYAIKGLGAIKIKMPRDRNGEFISKVVIPHERTDPRLKEDIAILHLAGLSTRTLAMISQRLLGIEVSAKTVTNSLEIVRDSAEKWLDRPLNKRYWALYIDGTNFKIKRRGSVEKEPSLVILGLGEDGCKSILAIEPGTRDDVNSWRAVFCGLKRRGFDAKAVRVGVMDGLPGLETLFQEEFSNAVTARCWAHAMRNACEKTPKRLRELFEKLAHRVMYATSEEAARQAFTALKAAMGRDAERAVSCLAKDLNSLLTHYRFDSQYWRALKTTNSIERVNKEFKRRTKSMETLGERTLKSIVVFTALRLEMGWRMQPVTSKGLENLIVKQKSENSLESAVDEMQLLN
jgi:putative transposase